MNWGYFPPGYWTRRKTMQRWEHFSNAELCCKCCGDNFMTQTFMERLERLRTNYSLPMIVVSAYRCPKHNVAVSSTGSEGPHTTGHAVDIAVFGHQAYFLIQLALREGFTGIGFKQTGEHSRRFVHLDDLNELINRPRPWIWTY